MSEQIQKIGSPKLPQWRLYLKENYKEGKSLLVFKSHHSISDGCGLVKLLGSVTDEDINLLEHLKKLSILEKIVIYSTLPYHLVTSTINLLFRPKENNLFANTIESSG